MANCYYKGKEVRSRSDRDRELKLSWGHTVTLKHTDINFRVTDTVASLFQEGDPKKVSNLIGLIKVMRYLHDIRWFGSQYNAF